jgi:predicted AAA+ superfamily ATPase
LKWTELRYDSAGERWRLYYLRDKEGREVDFVVTLDRRVDWLIEVKAADESLSGSLRYSTRKLRPKESFQLVLHVDKPQERDGVKIVPLTKWLEALPGSA